MMQKFIVPKTQDLPAQVTIVGQDAKHIYKVLRLSIGDMLSLTDGEGTDYTAKVLSISKESVLAEIIDAQKTITESPISITLCSGMLKDKKMDFIIKHVTQLGINTWIPFYCERSIPSPDAGRVKKRLKRWDAIARESLKQCRRSSLPLIKDPVEFETLLNTTDQYDLKIAFWEKAAQDIKTLKDQTHAKSILIIIGPEGGFSKSEIKMAQEKGFSPYLLGPRILRAETAAICSCTLIQHILGDI